MGLKPRFYADLALKNSALRSIDVDILAESELRDMKHLLGRLSDLSIRYTLPSFRWMFERWPDDGRRCANLKSFSAQMETSTVSNDDLRLISMWMPRLEQLEVTHRQGCKLKWGLDGRGLRQLRRLPLRRVTSADATSLAHLVFD